MDWVLTQRLTPLRALEAAPPHTEPATRGGAGKTMLAVSALLAARRASPCLARSGLTHSRCLAAAAQSVSPTTGAVLKEYPYMSDADAAAAVDSASAAYVEWAAMSFEERGDRLRAVGRLLRERAEPLAKLMAEEMGKPIREGRGEVEKCAGHAEYSAEQAEAMMAPEPTEVPGAVVAFRPIGVIFAIMPWNFPLWQVFRQACTALSAGNTVVLKHAPNVFGCADEIQRIFDDAGLPRGAFVNVRVDTPQVAALIEHRAVRCVSFTGSCAAGRKVAATAGAALKKVVLELGGAISTRSRPDLATSARSRAWLGRRRGRRPSPRSTPPAASQAPTRT